MISQLQSHNGKPWGGEEICPASSSAQSGCCAFGHCQGRVAHSKLKEAAAGEGDGDGSSAYCLFSPLLPLKLKNHQLLWEEKEKPTS